MKKFIALLALVAFTVSVNAQCCKGAGDKAKCPASKCAECPKEGKCPKGDQCPKASKPAEKKA